MRRLPLALLLSACTATQSRESAPEVFEIATCDSWLAEVQARVNSEGHSLIKWGDSTILVPGTDEEYRLITDKNEIEDQLMSEPDAKRIFFCLDRDGKDVLVLVVGE